MSQQSPGALGRALLSPGAVGGALLSPCSSSSLPTGEGSVGGLQLCLERSHPRGIRPEALDPWGRVALVRLALLAVPAQGLYRPLLVP